MAATHGVGTYGNAVGTVTPLDHKMAQLGLVVKTAANTIRAGLFWDGTSTIVSGKANMSLDVRAFTAVLSRGATAGAVLLTNDAVLNLTTDSNGATLVAPGSNSVYWNVFVWQREFSIDGTNSNPVISVLVGTSAPSPTVPALTSFPGAVSLATVLVPAGTTATNSGTTITQTGPFTTVDGMTVVARTTTERDAYVPPATDTKAKCWVIADGITYKWNGTVWKAWESDWITYAPTLANTTLGNGTVTGKYSYARGRIQAEGTFALGSTSAVGTAPTVTNPVNADAFSITQAYPLGDCRFGDAGTALYIGSITPVSASVSQFYVVSASGSYGSLTAVSATVPFTFGVSDSISWHFEFTPA